ncbi:MAG: tetratricopeptide repeat protein, partial [Pseudomonadota bacterium]
MARRWNLLYLVVLICGATSVHADDSLEPAPVLDPYYGQALFDFYQGEYFDSIVDILAADERDRLPNHAEDAELLLGGLYLSYGLHDTAAEIFERLLATKTRPEVRDRTWFFLAKIRYQRGYFERALEALQAIERPLVKSLRPEKRMMQAQTLMALGRYDEAALLLERWRGPGEWHHFASYNLGVAYIRAGNLQRGANILEDITSKRGVDRDEFQSLQDKANVALGYSYLQNEQPELAKKALQRVRLNGPFSNKALLGVGWADAAMENYGKALVPWLELRGRDLLDSAVQESLLAIPFAYGKLSANNEAAQQYLLAINAYVEESARLNDAIARIEDGTVVTSMLADELDKDLGWYWQLDSVPDSYESRYLYHLLAGHAFQEALKNFRDLAALQKNLQVWQENVDVFDHMLGTRKLAFEARLPGALALMESADLDALAAQSGALRAKVQTIEDN